jgi:hypothetical protein
VGQQAKLTAAELNTMANARGTEDDEGDWIDD